MFMQKLRMNKILYILYKKKQNLEMAEHASLHHLPIHIFYLFFHPYYDGSCKSGSMGRSGAQERCSPAECRPASIAATQTPTDKMHTYFDALRCCEQLVNAKSPGLSIA